MVKKKLRMKELFEEDEKTVIKDISNNVLPKEKGKKSFNMHKDVLDDLELLAWYYDRTYSEIAEEALRNYLTKEGKVLSKARELREEINSAVGR